MIFEIFLFVASIAVTSGQTILLGDVEVTQIEPRTIDVDGSIRLTDGNSVIIEDDDIMTLIRRLQEEIPSTEDVCESKESALVKSMAAKIFELEQNVESMAENVTNMTAQIKSFSTSGSKRRVWIYNHTGSDQYFTMPSGAKYITIVCIGAGGGGSYNDHTGGAGGVTKAKFSPNDVASNLTIVVGGCGLRNPSPHSHVSLESRAYGFGGVSWAAWGAKSVGMGGGLSGVFNGVVSRATALAVAGGGGGASPSLDGKDGNGANTGVDGNMQGLDGNYAGAGGGGCAGGKRYKPMPSDDDAGEGGTGCVDAKVLEQQILSNTNTGPVREAPDYDCLVFGKIDRIFSVPASVPAAGRGSQGGAIHVGVDSTATDGRVCIIVEF